MAEPGQESRQALVVGVTTFQHGLANLPDEPVRLLADAIRRHDRTVVHAACPSKKELSDLLSCVPRERFDVVHLLSHGEVSRSKRLLIAGSDAHQPAAESHQWVSVHNTVSELIDTPGDAMLVLLDVCYAGAAAEIDVEPLDADFTQNDRKVYILAATAPRDLAFDARFTRAVTTVLDRIERGDSLGADRSVEHINLSLVRTAIADELQRLCGNGSHQRLVSSKHGWDDLTHPLFRNRNYTPAAVDPNRPRDPVLGDIVDPLLGERHFSSRARGGDPSRDTAWCHFTGRLAELRLLSRWLDDPEQNGWLRVVTGSPGMGKSALLGVMVCLTHHDLRAYSPVVESRIADPTAKPNPRQSGEMAAVHARNREVAELVASIARQLGFENTTNTADLITKLRLSPRSIVVLDALDEAIDPSDVLLRLLVPLAAAGVCRLLVGARKQVRFDDLFATAASGQIDLDDLAPDQLRVDVAAYVVDLLREHARRWPSETAIAFAEATAETVTSVEAGAVEVGPMLLAQLYTHRVTRSPAPETAAAAAALGRWAPQSVKDAFRQELDSEGTDPWLGPMLVAFAHARGTGMPIGLAHTIAWRLNPGLPERSNQQLAELVSEQARFYLRSDIDSADCSALYALFHQSLQEYLIAYPYVAVHGSTSERSGPGVDGLILDALLDTFGYIPGVGGDWANRAVPYLKRHLGQHAIAAGRFDELVGDLEFLAHAEHDELMRDLRLAKSRDARLAAAIYRSSHDSHRTARPEHRLRLLALDAARFGATMLHDTATAIGAVRWSTGTRADVRMLDVLEGHSGPVVSVACATINGRPVAVTGGADATVRIWDLITGTPIGEPLNGHTLAVSAIACTMADGRPIAVTGGQDTTVRIWDLLTRTPIGEPLNGHTLAVSAIACTTVAGRPAAVTSGEDAVVRIWNLSTRHLMGQPLDVGSGRLRSLACAKLDGRAVVVIATGHEPNVRVWDLVSRTVVGETLHQTDTRWVGAAGFTELGGRPVAIIATGEDRTWRVWDLARKTLVGEPFAEAYPWEGAATFTEVNGHLIVGSAESLSGFVRVRDLTTGSQVGELLYGHTRKVRAIAFTQFDGLPVMVTGSDDTTVRVWNLDAEAQVAKLLRGHTFQLRAMVSAEVDGRPVAVTAGDDRDVRVWDLDTGRAVGEPLLGHTNPVRSMACTMLNGRPVVVTAGTDQVPRIWDLSTRDIVGTLPGNAGGVLSLACATLNARPVIVTVGVEMVLVWDLATGELIRELARWPGERISSVACTTSLGRPVAVTGSDIGVCVWDLGTGEPICETPIRATEKVSAIACSSLGGRPVAVTAGDMGVRVWDLATGDPSGELGGRANERVSVIVCSSLRGRPIAVTGGEMAVRVWDLTTGEQLAVHDFPAAVRAVACAPQTIVVGYGMDVAALRYSGLGVDR
ncbi:hypothetical protein ACFXHA_05260 [Nocardia sp. NPDC059240]|uniref:hypothetical protein n=1 Tax=Nocardia sp. NPDC059240 TaxID=3346786 RepID=UPI00368765FF